MKEARMEIVQGYFDMIDQNKWLLFNAMNEEQEKQARNHENKIINELSNLVVPEKAMN